MEVLNEDATRYILRYAVADGEHCDLSLRQICRRWRRLVNEILQELDIGQDLSGRGYPPPGLLTWMPTLVVHIGQVTERLVVFTNLRSLHIIPYDPVEHCADEELNGEGVNPRWVLRLTTLEALRLRTTDLGFRLLSKLPSLRNLRYLELQDKYIPPMPLTRLECVYFSDSMRIPDTLEALAVRRFETDVSLGTNPHFTRLTELLIQQPTCTWPMQLTNLRELRIGFNAKTGPATISLELPVQKRKHSKTPIDGLACPRLERARIHCGPELRELPASIVHAKLNLEREDVTIDFARCTRLRTLICKVGRLDCTWPPQRLKVLSLHEVLLASPWPSAEMVELVEVHYFHPQALGADPLWKTLNRLEDSAAENLLIIGGEHYTSSRATMPRGKKQLDLRTFAALRKLKVFQRPGVSIYVPTQLEKLVCNATPENMADLDLKRTRIQMLRGPY